jgi:hypothetical protein
MLLERSSRGIVLSIAGAAFRRAVHTRTFLVVLGLSLALLVVELSRIGYLRAAEAAGELEQVAAIRTSGAVGVLGLWFDATLLVGLILGTTAISFEARNGTLESLLAKPIGRLSFLAGHWLGLQVFLLLFLVIGIGSGFSVLALPRLEPGAAFWWGLAQLLARTFVMTSLFVCLGSLLRPVTAGSLALALYALPELVQPWLDDPRLLVRVPAMVGQVLAPAVLPGDPISAGLTRSSLAPIGWLPGLVVLENVLYGLAVLLVCGILFARRDLPPPV